MANVEYYEKRVAGKLAEIAKLEKKLARIIKAKESNWENNPYYYREDDLRITNKDLDAARAVLADYQAKLTAETEKDASRNIKAIIDFLNTWAENVYSYYEERFTAYLEAKAEDGKRDKDYCNRWNSGEPWKNPTEWKEYEKEHRKAHKLYTEAWHFMFPYDEFGKFNGAKLTKELEQDKKAKYDDLVERVNAICGTITDARGLSVGAKGELNGLIKGERGNAWVETISAGGYNIQCFHFRTLIHEVK